MATERKAPIGKNAKKRAAKPKAPAKKASAAKSAKQRASIKPTLLLESKLDIEWVPRESVKPYAKNPRIIPQKAIDKVKRSLIDFGWRQPLVVDRDRALIVGHTRWLAAGELKANLVPIHIAHNLSPAAARAYRLMDNRSGQESQWDYELAGEEIAALEQEDFDLSATGFDQGEIEIALGRGDGSIDADAEWQAMPEYNNKDESGHQIIVIHFQDQAAVDRFQKFAKQPITEKTKYVWLPFKPKEDYYDRIYDAAKS